MSISSPLTWHGGKARLAERIVSHFPPHRTYCEPFGGGAAVLLRKPPSPVEIYNDVDRSVASLFRVLRTPALFRQLLRSLDKTPYARSEFEMAEEPTNDPVEGARRLIVRQRQSFGGRGERWSYAISDSHAGVSSAVRRWQRGIELLPSVHRRFQSVQIECADWRIVVDRYDSKETLFFVDPPYFPSTRIGGGYHHEMSTDDHHALIRRILTIRGMLVLSGYANEAYKPLEHSGWTRIDYDVPAYSSRNRARRVESLWLSPSITNSERIPRPVRLVSDKMREGAYHVHSLRTARTTKKVLRALEKLRSSGEKPTIVAVAKLARLSREHLGRRYKHLFT